jgi:integrase
MERLIVLPAVRDRLRTALLKWHAATSGISEYLFFNPQRPNTYIRSVKTAWHNALRRSGLPPFPLYNARHTYATRLAAAGVSDTVIDQPLGHARRDILRFYTVPVPEYLRDAVTRLEQLRAAKTGQPHRNSSVPGVAAGVVRGSTLIQ